MADDKIKPTAFKPGGPLSAGALNALRDAMPRLLKGGAGIVVEKFGERWVVRLADDQGAAADDKAIVVVTAIFDTYLQCDKDGATINVAKPWGLRKGSEWPTGYDPVANIINYTYVYSDASTRVQTDNNGVTQNQSIIPNWEIGEEILVCRLPSARINDTDGNLIRWYDLNVNGRGWAGD